MTELLEAKSSLIEVRRAVTLFLLKGGALTEIDGGVKALNKRLETSRDGFKRQERKDRMISAIEHLKEYRVGVDELAKVREDKEKFPAALEVLRAAGQEIQDQMESVTIDLNADLKTAEATMLSTSQNNERVLKISGVVATILGLIIAFFIGRGITVPIKKALPQRMGRGLEGIIARPPLGGHIKR